MATAEEAREALKQCFDPEIPVNIVDLGLIYDIQIEGNEAKVQMSLTSPHCPAAAQIPDDVKSRLETLDGIETADVEVVWEPTWDQSRISDEGKKILGIE